MALVRPSSLVGAISGAIASVTFYNRKTGTVVGHRGRPPTTKSQQRVAAQAEFMRIVHKWNGTLTASQREQWRKAAQTYQRTNRIGQRRNISGFQLFVRANSFKEIQTLPPKEGTTPAPEDVVLSWTEGGPFNITLTNPYTPAQLPISVYASTTRSLKDRNAFYKWHEVFHGNYGVATKNIFSDWPTDYLALPIEDEVVGVRIVAVAKDAYPSAIGQYVTTIL